MPGRFPCLNAVPSLYAGSASSVITEARNRGAALGTLKVCEAVSLLSSGLNVQTTSLDDLWLSFCGGRQPLPPSLDTTIALPHLVSREALLIGVNPVIPVTGVGYSCISVAAGRSGEREHFLAVASAAGDVLLSRDTLIAWMERP